MKGEGERELEVLLSYLVNRQLKQSEVIVALGISRSAYNDQKARGVLASPANLLAVAQYFGLNPVTLLLRYGYIQMEDVRAAQAKYDTPGIKYDGDDGNPSPPTRKGGLATAEHSSRHIGPGI